MKKLNVIQHLLPAGTEAFFKPVQSFLSDPVLRDQGVGVIKMDKRHVLFSVVMGSRQPLFGALRPDHSVTLFHDTRGGTNWTQG